MPEEMLASTAIVQSGANTSNYVNTKFPAEMANLALKDAVDVARIVSNNAAQMQAAQGQNLIASAGSITDRLMNSAPSELAGENKILYSTPPVAFTGVGPFPAASPATAGSGG